MIGPFMQKTAPPSYEGGAVFLWIIFADHAGFLFRMLLDPEAVDGDSGQRFDIFFADF